MLSSRSLDGVRADRPEINLSELQKSLDSTALELVENQKENMVGRKKLAEQTRGKLHLSRATPGPS